MKRTALILLIIYIFLAVGCSANQTEKGEASAGIVSETTLEEPYDSESSADAPRLLIFENKGEITDFVDSPNLSDADFAEYVTANEYIYNGVESKADAVGMIDMISKAFMPESEDYPLVSMSIYTDRKICIINAHGDGETSFGFWYDFADEKDAHAKLESAGKEFGLTEVQACECFDVDELYVADYEGLFHLFYAIKDDVFFGIRAFGFDSPEKALESFGFELV